MELNVNVPLEEYELLKANQISNFDKVHTIQLYTSADGKVTIVHTDNDSVRALCRMIVWLQEEALSQNNKVKELQKELSKVRAFNNTLDHSLD